VAAPARARAVAQVVAGLATRELRALGSRADTDSAQRGRARARAVRHALEELGPFYVKLGQMLATRPDMVPQAMIEEFEHLHDQVSPLPFSALEPVLDAELGPDWRSRFRSVQVDKPLGAASLAQAYQVELDDGRPGVIKIQRPGIADLMREDMALTRRMARIIGRRTPDFTEVVDVEAMLDMIFEIMEPELDFTVEAENMDAARRVADGFALVEVPDVVHATPRVLVQSMARSARGSATPSSCSRRARTSSASCAAPTSWSASSTPTRTPATSSSPTTASPRSSTGAWSGGWTGG
jgi:ubiquinone biosynthesis protein